MRYTVGEVAAFAGITVRALHHYDKVGLLSPSGRSPAGYRLYDDADVARVQRILIYRELGCSLDDISAILDDPTADPAEHLFRQRELLRAQIARLRRMVEAVDALLEAEKMELSLTPEERFELFGDWVPEDYADEASERWGDTDAWAQSTARTAGHTVADWRTIRAQTDAIERGLAEALAAGDPADSPAALDLAERHRAHITRWFYDCGPDLHRGLAELYVTDPRFAAHYDDLAPGLARYLRDAIVAGADRAGQG